MAATGGLGGIGGPPPSSGAIGAVGTTSAGEGPGRPIGGAADAGQGERTFSTEGGPQYGGRTPPPGQEGASDLGPFPGTTSAIGGMGADLEGGKGGKGFGVPGTGGEGPPAATRPLGRANADISAGESSYVN